MITLIAATYRPRTNERINSIVKTSVFEIYSERHIVELSFGHHETQEKMTLTLDYSSDSDLQKILELMTMLGWSESPVDPTRRWEWKE